MAYLTPESESSTTADLSWTQLLSNDRPRPSIVKTEDKAKGLIQEEVPSPEEVPARRRSESLMGTLNRHLGSVRTHLKAVSDTPNRINR